MRSYVAKIRQACPGAIRVACYLTLAYLRGTLAIGLLPREQGQRERGREGGSARGRAAARASRPSSRIGRLVTTGVGGRCSMRPGASDCVAPASPCGGRTARVPWAARGVLPTGKRYGRAPITTYDGTRRCSVDPQRRRSLHPLARDTGRCEIAWRAPRGYRAAVGGRSGRSGRSTTLGRRFQSDAAAARQFAFLPRAGPSQRCTGSHRRRRRRLSAVPSPPARSESPRLHTPPDLAAAEAQALRCSSHCFELHRRWNSSCL